MLNCVRRWCTCWMSCWRKGKEEEISNAVTHHIGSTFAPAFSERAWVIFLLCKKFGANEETQGLGAIHKVFLLQLSYEFSIDEIPLFAPSPVFASAFIIRPEGVSFNFSKPRGESWIPGNCIRNEQRISIRDLWNQQGTLKWERRNEQRISDQRCLKSEGNYEVHIPLLISKFYIQLHFIIPYSLIVILRSLKTSLFA